MIPAGLAAVVALARKRMRINRALAVAGPALVAVGAAGLIWVVVSRVVLLPDLDAPVAVGLAAALCAAVVIATCVRLPPVWAAWAADRWLGTRDRFATAVELVAGASGELGGLAARQVAAANEAAGGIRRLPAGPNVPTRTLSVGAVIVALAVGAGALPNPQDAVRERQAAERALVAAEAEALREAAQTLRAPRADPVRDEAAQQLEQLADSLDEATLEQALRAVEAAKAELGKQLDSDLPAQRTALTGLARELARSPLGDGDSVRSQLDHLADRLASDQVPAEELGELAERLQSLSDALSQGAPGVAGELSEAASAAARGDAGAASRALSQASGAVGDALRHAQSQEALAEAQGALSDAAGALRSGAAGQGQGEGQGQGQDDGQGDGQGQGQGQGDGQGQGQGQGGGGAGGGGNPSGPVSDGGSRSGAGGAAGRGAGEDGERAGGRDLDLQTVFDPPQRLDTDGEDVHVTNSADDPEPGTEVGRAQGSGRRSDAIVPYLDVLGSYAEQATRTISADGYPVRLRDTVRDYFDRLGAPAR